MTLFKTPFGVSSEILSRFILATIRIILLMTTLNNSVWDSVWYSVWDSVRDSVLNSAYNSVWNSVHDSLCIPVHNFSYEYFK